MSNTTHVRGASALFSYRTAGYDLYPVVENEAIVSLAFTDMRGESHSMTETLEAFVLLEKRWVGRPYSKWLRECVGQSNLLEMRPKPPFLVEQADGWYFGDETEQLNGPWQTRGQALTMSIAYGVNLDVRAPFPRPTCRYRHPNGTQYTVLAVVNEHSDRPEYPVEVAYEGDNGRTWSKPLAEFMRKMTLLPATGPVSHEVTDRGPVRVITSAGGMVLEESVNEREVMLQGVSLTVEMVGDLLPYLTFFLANHQLPDSRIR